MKDNKLVSLNFNQLLKYENVDGYNSHLPYKCNGFCIDCEKKGLLEGDQYLEAISHAADSDDYFRLSGKKYKNNTRIMMIFENPGGNAKDYLGEWIEHEGVKKYVPCHIYYWLDSLYPNPPKSIDELVKINRYYGPYLAYLIEKFDLNNVYITNLTKCKLRGASNYWKVRENCIENIFKKEISIIKPEMLVFFGKNASNFFMTSALSEYHKLPKAVLFHPGAINLSQRQDMSHEEMIEENNFRLEELLQKQ